MNKLIVLSALAFVTGAANAGNIINDNVFYGPVKGRFYNIVTPVEFNTKFEQFYTYDEFGYGITDSLTVALKTMASYDSSNNPEFGKWAWNNLSLELDWSVLGQGEQRADIYARIQQLYNTKDGLETVAYNWTLGTHVGRMAENWTLAGIVELDYIKDDVSRYDSDAWAMTVGLFGQYLIDSSWSLIGKLDFDFDLYEKYYDEMRLMLELGANYNIDATKYIGLYISKDLVRDFEDAPMVFGGKFGIDF
jgi:hypothetical protein